MNAERPAYDLRRRTKDFAVRIVRLYVSLSSDAVAQVMGRQILRSGTSVGAHYREAFRARSTAEFISKMEGALQELDETSYWLELLIEWGRVSNKSIGDLMAETDELIRIFVTAVRSTKQRGK
jgi:four helix bundle protein